MPVSSPLGGKVVVVTGAARGIGAALAERLAAEGARLALVGLEPDALAEVARRCGPNAACWEADVTDGARLEEVAKLVVERFSRIDAVVANAGIAAGGSLLVADPVSYDRVIEVNLLGSVRTARAFLPYLVRSHGYYLQIASMAAIVPMPMMGAYNASKAGVEQFANTLRTEVAHHGVDVGIAYYSWTDTDMVRGGDRIPGTDRSSLPGVFGATGDLAPAIERTVAGIRRRSAHIYGQRHIRGIPGVRALMPALIYRMGRKEVAAREAAIAQAGPEATRPVGAGGQADSAARR